MRNVAPDLIVHFGALYWRSIGSIGHGRLHLEENDTGPDACNHAQFGAFILAGSNCPLKGKVEGARLLDHANADKAGWTQSPSNDAGQTVGQSKSPPKLLILALGHSSAKARRCLSMGRGRAVVAE